jgi:hypothetical protein
MLEATTAKMIEDWSKNQSSPTPHHAWPSLRRLVSNSANTASMSRKALPAAVLVSIGCSIARNATPLDLGIGPIVAVGAVLGQGEKPKISAMTRAKGIDWSR